MSDENWIRWFGSDTAPINENQTVDIKYRSGTVVESVRVGDYRWSHAPSPVDIVAYRRSAMDNTMTPEEAELTADEHQGKYSAYHKDVRHLKTIDVYRTVDLFGCEAHGHAISHAAKKLLLTGSRTGGKSVEQDVSEAIDSLQRWLEMREEDRLARELEQ